MKTIAPWRMWLASVLMGRRPRRAHFTFYPAGTPRWKRWWYRFRPPPPPPHRPFPRQPWMGPPDDELGVTVPIRHRVTSGAEAVIVVTDCVAYTTGFSLGVGIRKMHEPAPRQFPAAGPSDEMTLDLGIRFSDGRETSMSGGGRSSPAIDWYRAWQEGLDPPTPPGPIIGPSGGGGGGRRWDMNYWIWPLPTDGPMTITCRWPVGGVPDGHVEADGAAIRRAGLGSEKLWSDGR